MNDGCNVPGPIAWKAIILPLDQECLMANFEKSRYIMSDTKRRKVKLLIVGVRQAIRLERLGTRETSGVDLLHSAEPRSDERDLTRSFPNAQVLVHDTDVEDAILLHSCSKTQEIICSLFA
jgi:hypothetical protein